MPTPPTPSARPSSILLEVIVQSLADAREAARGGADRLEVVRDIRLGGLTPPLTLVRTIARETSLPLRVMLRENAGYDTTREEVSTLRRAARELAAEGIDGLVVGFARDGLPGLDEVRSVLDAAPGVAVTFHRAFDQLQDPIEAIDRIAAIEQIDRILTDGGGGTPADRCDRLREYAARAGGRVEIIAGGGVDEALFALIVSTKSVREVHVGRLARDGGNQEAPVSAARVRRLRELAG